VTDIEFLDEMNDLLDSDKVVTLESLLDDIEEWDSLSYVSFLAMATTKWGVKDLKSSDVKAAKTVADLYSLVK